MLHTIAAIVLLIVTAVILGPHLLEHVTNGKPRR
jgi:hypothetical protein